MVGLFGEELCRSGRDAGATTHQLHIVPHADVASFDHNAVHLRIIIPPCQRLTQRGCPASIASA